jgi:CheY-like chemotaxis protein
LHTSCAAVRKLEGVRVLLVEDHDDTRELLRKLLELCGAVVVDVPGGRAALSVLDRTRPDVVVSDISMPDGDGFWLLGRIRQSLARLPAVAVTAVASPESVLAAGFTACLTKPVDPDHLCATVASAVAG